jgi:glycosyltransferase involved in cell wall biosynthesis
MTGPPLISVVIPTKNRPDRLAVAVRSVLEQTHPNVEVVVVDDGSDVPAAPAPDDRRVHLVRLERSVGPAAARNAGMRAAAGPFLSLLDDDDYFYPHKLETQLRYLATHPHVDLVFSRVRVIEPDGRPGFSLREDYRHDPVENLRLFNVIHTNSVLFRRELAARCQFDERLRKYTDTQFFMAASFCGAIHYLPAEVAVWHRGNRPDQVTRADLASDYQNFALIREIFSAELGRYPAVRAEYDRMRDDLLERLRALAGRTPPLPGA